MSAQGVAARSTRPLEQISLAALESVFDRGAILEAVANGFIQYDAGHFTQPEPVYLPFIKGDCHIKTGFQRAGDYFTIKLATGFHDNWRLGLPNANGLVLLASQETGEPVALLQDRGMLTAWRTVAATVLASKALLPQRPIRLGIVGTGLQAALAAEWLLAEIDPEAVTIWGRSVEKATLLANGLPSSVTIDADLETLCRTSNLIITTTPSTQPIVRADWIQPGTHIVAVGADAPGKIEIEPTLFARAAIIVTDDHRQCLDHGEFGQAVRAGVIDAAADIPLGAILGGRIAIERGSQDITIVDLTGLAVQDDAIARIFIGKLLQEDAADAR